MGDKFHGNMVKKKCGLIRSHFYYGAKIENVSLMLGHTNITQTQRYAKVLAQSVQSDYTMMAKKLESK